MITMKFSLHLPHPNRNVPFIDTLYHKKAQGFLFTHHFKCYDKPVMISLSKIFSLSTIAILVIASILLINQLLKSRPTSGWQSINTGPFTVSLPPSWKFNKLQGTDSFVGEFVGNGIKLSFDYGWYSDPLNRYQNDPNYFISEEIISNYLAKIIYPKSNLSTGTIGIHFPTTHPPLPNQYLLVQTNRLTITANTKENEKELILYIFRSIKFKQ
ncbi:MAG: hypothetical protein G01um101416_783 [Microgenomates group bacterium Gr01-1014_16]|nr:MAG: hypothetical protein G01um101416_783 [Microgenomates group bacterium Gr01-1014_16]